MGDRTCPIETDGSPCGKPSAKADSRKWCTMHRNRWYRHGDVHYLGRSGIAKGASADERFWAKVDAAGDCWVWVSAIGTHGYGMFNVSPGKTETAHRYAYETLVGPVSKDLHLDHLCRNRACCNPDHLEPVTPYENMRRGALPHINIPRSSHSLKRECKYGHPLSGGNLYVSPRGVRACRACARRRVDEFQQRRRSGIRVAA